MRFFAVFRSFGTAWRAQIHARCSPKIWRYSEHRCVRKLGKTDFVGVALFRDPLLVAPPGEHLVPNIRDPKELWKMALERGRYLLPVRRYGGYPKIEKSLKFDFTKIWNCDFGYFFICCRSWGLELMLKFLRMGRFCNSIFPFYIFCHNIDIGPHCGPLGETIYAFTLIVLCPLIRPMNPWKYLVYPGLSPPTDFVQGDVEYGELRISYRFRGHPVGDRCTVWVKYWLRWVGNIPLYNVWKNDRDGPTNCRVIETQICEQGDGVRYRWKFSKSTRLYNGPMQTISSTKWQKKSRWTPQRIQSRLGSRWLRVHLCSSAIFPLPVLPEMVVGHRFSAKMCCHILWSNFAISYKFTSCRRWQVCLYSVTV